MSSKRLSTSTIGDTASNKASSLGQFIEATGGTVSTITDGGVTYKLHRFNSAGTFTVTKCSNGAKAEVLLVGAGGSGGYAANPGARYGGGGGGGAVFIAEFEVSPQNYTVTVGAARSLGSRTGGPSGIQSQSDGSVRLGVGGGGTQNTDGGNGGGRSYNNSTLGRGIQPTGWDATGSAGAGASGSSTTGYNTNFAGLNYTYGIGGNGGQSTVNNATRYGEGGEGPSATSTGNPSNGYPGVVYVRYAV